MAAKAFKDHKRARKQAERIERGRNLAAFYTERERALENYRREADEQRKREDLERSGIRPIRKGLGL